MPRRRPLTIRNARAAERIRRLEPQPPLPLAPMPPRQRQRRDAEGLTAEEAWRADIRRAKPPVTLTIEGRDRSAIADLLIEACVALENRAREIRRKDLRGYSNDQADRLRDYADKIRP